MTVTILPFLKINILFFPLLIASIIGDYFVSFSVAYLCATIHELTHIITAKALGVGISYMEILPFGICARLKSDIIKNPNHEITIALSGPFLNIIIAVITGFVKPYFPEKAELLNYIICCNISMAAVNLIPALPLDGGRALRAYITTKSGSLFAYNFMTKFSVFPIALLLLIAVFLLLYGQFNFSIILIGVFLLSNLCAEQKNISKHTLNELLKYEDKLKKDAMNKATAVTAHKSTPARRILRHLSYNTYHIVFVTEDDLTISKTLTEGQIIKALSYRGTRITLGEI